MKNPYFRYFLLTVYGLIMPLVLYAEASTAYITGAGSNELYKINLLDGSFSPIVPAPTLPGAALSGIAIPTPTTAYVTGILNSTFYSFDLTNGNNILITSIPGAGLDRIALASNTSAYITGYGNGNVYQINTTNGSFRQVNQSTISTGFAGIALNMTLETPTLAWLTDDTGLFQLNLNDGSLSRLFFDPSSSILLRGIALMNNTTAYSVGFNNNIYKIDLLNNNLSIITTLPSFPNGGAEGIVLANATTAYVVIGQGAPSPAGIVYRVDLTNGTFSQVALVSGSSSFDIALFLQIGTEGLTGNNLRFAEYLNENASFRVLPLFALQSDIAGTLQSAIPTRNAIFTFAAQTTQLAFGQLVFDHIAQKTHGITSKMAGPSLREEISLPSSFIASASDKINYGEEADIAQQETICNKRRKDKNNSAWLGTFGQYSREKAQQQTPAFQANAAGGIVAFDCFQNDWALMGTGAAYGYTHVHEKKGAGHANVNQGAAVLYAAFYDHDWGSDFSFWGGYYHVDNIRHIVIPQIAEANAISTTHGWQFTPHFAIYYKNTPSDWLIIEPFNMIDWVACWEDGFQEHGAGLLNMGQKSRFCSLLRNELGVRFHEILQLSWGEIRFLETCGYMYQKTFGTGTLQTFLVGSPSSFTVSTLTGAQNLGAVEFQTLFIPNNQKYPYGTISYQGEFGSAYQLHWIMLSLGLDF